VAAVVVVVKLNLSSAGGFLVVGGRLEFSRSFVTSEQIPQKQKGNLKPSDLQPAFLPKPTKILFFHRYNAVTQYSRYNNIHSMFVVIIIIKNCLSPKPGNPTT
jgi:hypothetical protein